MTAIRILRIITRLNAGGPSRHVVWLARGLSSRGFETRLAAGRLAPGEDDLSEFAAENGVAVASIPDLQRDPRPAADARAFREVLRLVREFRPHVVHTHHSKAGFVGRLAVRIANRRIVASGGAPIRAVHTFHGNMISRHFSPWKAAALGSLERWISHDGVTDAVVVLSPDQRREIVDEFRLAPAGKVFIVPNAVDLDAFAPCARDLSFRRAVGAEDGDFVVGMIGRVAPQKNYEMFLRVARRVVGALPRAMFVVVGGGEGLPELQAMAAELGIASRVRFPGVRTDLPSVYAGLDLVALTSRNEGTPLSLIEAMAAARPIVSTDVGGVRDLVTRELRGGVDSRSFVESDSPRGLLCASEAEGEFADAVLRLAGDADLRARLSGAGREYAIRFHGLPRLFDDLEAVYARVLRRDGSEQGRTES